MERAADECETDIEVPLDENQLHWKRLIKRFAQGLVGYAIIYYVIEEGNHVPLVTYDTSHGFPHRDLRYLERGDKRRKKEISARTLEEAFDISDEDLERNWMNFFAEYERKKAVKNEN